MKMHTYPFVVAVERPVNAFISKGPAKSIPELVNGLESVVRSGGRVPINCVCNLCLDITQILQLWNVDLIICLALGIQNWSLRYEALNCYLHVTLWCGQIVVVAWKIFNCRVGLSNTAHCMLGFQIRQFEYLLSPLESNGFKFLFG